MTTINIPISGLDAPPQRHSDTGELRWTGRLDGPICIKYVFAVPTSDENLYMTARQDDAVKAAVIHQLRDKWRTPEEAASALNLPLSTVQRWWSTDVEKVTWTPA